MYEGVPLRESHAPFWMQGYQPANVPEGLPQLPIGLPLRPLRYQKHPTMCTLRGTSKCRPVVERRARGIGASRPGSRLVLMTARSPRDFEKVLVQQKRGTIKDLDLMSRTEPANPQSDEPLLRAAPDPHSKGGTKATSSSHRDLAQ